MAKKSLPAPTAPLTPGAANALLAELRVLIREARQQTAQVANAALTLTYWRVGDRIRREILKGKRADYGDEIVATVSRQLATEFGRGFAEKNLRRMLQFAEVFPDEQIVVALIRQLTWTHFIALIPLKEPLQREFYAEMCRVERWTVRTLRERIQSMLYERTAISKKPEKLIEQELRALRDADMLTPDLVFRDPYLLDVRHDNREGIADAVSRTLGRRCLSRPTYLKSKDDRKHSLLVKRRLTTKCPDHAPQGLRSTVKATLLELQFHRTSGSPVGKAFDDDADRSGRSNRARPDSQRSG